MDELLCKVGLNPIDTPERNLELLYIRLDESENNQQNVTDEKIIQQLKEEQILLEEALEALTKHKKELDTALVTDNQSDDPLSASEKTATTKISEVEFAIERMIAQEREKNEQSQQHVIERS